MMTMLPSYVNFMKDDENKTSDFCSWLSCSVYE